MLFAGGFVLATLVRPADVLQGSLLFGAGDLVAQRLEGRAAGGGADEGRRRLPDLEVGLVHF